MLDYKALTGLTEFKYQALQGYGHSTGSTKTVWAANFKALAVFERKDGTCSSRSLNQVIITFQDTSRKNTILVAYICESHSNLSYKPMEKHNERTKLFHAERYNSDLSHVQTWTTKANIWDTGFNGPLYDHWGNYPYNDQWLLPGHISDTDVQLLRFQYQN